VRTFGKCYEQADSINSDTIRVEVLCDDGNCPEGMSCIDGLCYGDPCALIECPAGHSCYEGGCFQDCSAFAFGPDTVLQQGQQLVLDAGDQAAPYFWSTGDTTYSITVTQPGIYWLNTFSPCYQAVDSIRVDYACDQGNCPEGQACVNGLCVTEDPCADIVCPSGESCYGGGCFQTCPDLELGPDITVPGGTGILLDAGDDWSDVYWSTGDFGNELMVNSSGRYIAAVLGNGVCYDADVQMDTINVMFTAYADGSCPPGQFNLNGYCYSSDQTSGCGEGYYRYDGECIPLNDCSLLTCPPGDTCYNGYCLPAFNAACDDCGPGEICYFGTCYPECVNSVEDLFMSLVSSGGAGLYGAYVPPELLRFVSALPGDTITIDPGPGFINIQWSNGDTGTIEITSSGTYSYVAEYEPENCTYIGVVFADFFCSGGDCPEGQICEDGICVDFDPCQYAFCPPGAACYNGFCLQLDIQTCFSNPCPPGEVCVNGFCAAESACSNVDCGPGETCVGGICYPNAEYDLCGDVDCGGIYSCLYGSCMQAETVSGPATISGVVAFAAGLKKGISFADDAVAGDAVEGARVYLLNPELDVVYKLDTTDASGSFSLNGIPEGTYKIVVESGLFTMDENNTIEISGDKVAYEILALIGEDEITIEEVTGMLPGKTFERFTIYPNPSTGDIYLSVGRAPGRLNVRLTDLAGRTVVSRQVEVRGSETRIIESGDDVLPGIYFLQIRKAGEMLGTERIVIY
jgi:hypothetical protein